MKKLIRLQVIATLLFLLHATTNAQTSKWHYCAGGSSADFGFGVSATSDGGAIAIGTTVSTDFDAAANLDDVNGNFLVVKLTASGSKAWGHCYGGSGAENGNCIKQTKDGGYIACGQATYPDGDVKSLHGINNADYWILKLTAYGAISWSKSYGGSSDDVATSVQQTYDGGYIIAGYTTSSDGDVTGFHSGAAGNVWVVKINDTGKIIWQKCMGGSLYDQAYSIKQTTDSGYIVAGLAMSSDGDISHKWGSKDVWLIKLNKNGGIVWEKTYGGPGDEYASDVQQTTDGGYIFAGYTSSTSGQVVGAHPSATSPPYAGDGWVGKTDDTGHLQWQLCLGGGGGEEMFGVMQTTDGYYMAAGYAESTDGDVTSLVGGQSGWLVKIYPTGSIKWQKCFGGTYTAQFRSIAEMQDHSIVCAGYGQSVDGDLTGSHNTNGTDDMWIMAIGHAVTIPTINSGKEINVYPTITTGIIHIDLPEGYESSQILLLDILGRPMNIPQGAGLNRRIEIPGNVPQGVYTLQVINNNTISACKIAYQGN